MAKFALALAVALLSSRAAADWPNTRWDMAVEEVAALFPDAVRIDRLIPVIGEPDVVARLRANAANGERTVFYFRAERLSRIEVDYGEASRCPEVLKRLRDQYGAPLREEKIYQLTVFSWLVGRDDIVLRWLDAGAGPGGCSIVHKKAFG